MALRSVSTLVLDGLAIFEFGVICEVFGIDRSADGVPNFDFKVCGPKPGKPLRTSVGATITPDHGLDDLHGADLVAIPAIGGSEYLPEALKAVREAAESGSIILTVCSGAFVAGAAGLLDGRPCTTHWMHADELARQHPQVDVRADVLYVADGPVLTSAGKTAALDLCLHLVHTDLGASAANGLARRLVVPSHRPGGQAQFIARPPDPRVTDRLGLALDWARARLDQPITVQDLAREAGLSTRQLARRMAAEVGVTPLGWLHHQRITRAQDLLERTNASVEQIAHRCGMGTSTTLRRQFQGFLGVSPTVYRTTFRH